MIPPGRESMKKKPARRSFTREFKIEAVRQVVEQNRPMAEVARELGIRAGLLGRWKEQVLADREGAFPGKGRLKVADEELRRLERENRSLRLELEFVKKTAAYFAKERSRGSA
jgi:transposase